MIHVAEKISHFANVGRLGAKSMKSLIDEYDVPQKAIALDIDIYGYLYQFCFEFCVEAYFCVFGDIIFVGRTHSINFTAFMNATNNNQNTFETCHISMRLA